MFRLALQSLRHRTGGFMASFIALFLGATIVMTFASMLDTSGGSSVTSADRDTLVIMANVVGGFALVIVIFAATSTLTLSVRQRGAEMAVLKHVGATPAQIGRMIVGETTIVALAGSLLAILPAMLGGWLLLEALASTGQVSATVPYRFGPIALGLGLGINLVAATVAAALTARSTTRKRASESSAAAMIETPGTGKKRVIAAVVLLAVGIGLGVVTATVSREEGYESMQTAGQASIWASIGFALLAPVLLRAIITVLGHPLAQMTGAGSYLALLNLRQRSHQMASIAMPIILFTGLATGTLYMQDIENSVTSVEGVAKSTIQKNIETLNYVFVGMIVLFAAIMLINTLVAATTYRSREFGQQRLAGSTPPQMLSMVVVESIVLAVTGVLFGSIASLVTVVPFSIARTGSPVPDSPAGIYLGIVAVAVIITIVPTLTTTRRVIRTSAVEAVAA